MTAFAVGGARGAVVPSLIVLGLLLAACGQSSTGPVSSGEKPAIVRPPAAPALPDGLQGVALPAFPQQDAPGGVIRAARATSITVPGDAPLVQGGSRNYSPGPGRLSVIAGPGELAFAHYSIGNVTDSRPTQLRIDGVAAILPGSDEDLPMSYWLGLADYTSFRWDWRGPYSNALSVVLNSDEVRERYVSAGGSMNYVVIAIGGAPPTAGNPEGLAGVTVRSSTVQTPQNYLANKPHYTVASAPEAGNNKGGSRASKAGSALVPSQYVTLRWEHVTAFNPPDQQNEAFQYQVFRKGLLDQFPINIGSVLAPESVYVDPLDNASVAPGPTPGATYEYYVRSINPNGFTPLTPAGRITIPLLPPAQVAASDGVFDDKIRLNWTKAEGASSYAIYRDDMNTPFAEVGNVSTWEDSDVPDTEVHVYAVQSHNPFGSSVLSPPENGNRRQAIQPYDIMEGDSVTGPFMFFIDAEFNPVTNQPIVSYTSDGGDAMTHLFEFAPGTGWVESIPCGHGDPGYGAPCNFAFKPNGDLGVLFGNVNWDGVGWDASWETDFGLRLNGQSNFSFEFVEYSSGFPSELCVVPPGNEWGRGWTISDGNNYAGLQHGNFGNFTDTIGTPQFFDAGNAWTFAIGYDDDPTAPAAYIAYVDGVGKPLMLWYIIAGTWQTAILDPAPCYGLNLKVGANNEVYILYQRRNAQFISELRLARGTVDRQTMAADFSSELVAENEFVGYLQPSTTDMEIDSQGQPHIMYPTNLLNGGQEQLWYRYRDAQGWTEHFELDTNSETYIEARYSALALDANDKPLLVFARARHHLKALWFK